MKKGFSTIYKALKVEYDVICIENQQRWRHRSSTWDSYGRWAAIWRINVNLSATSWEHYWTDGLTQRLFSIRNRVHSGSTSQQKCFGIMMKLPQQLRDNRSLCVFFWFGIMSSTGRRCVLVWLSITFDTDKHHVSIRLDVMTSTDRQWGFI